MYGFHGRYLRVDLTNATSAICEIPERALRRHLGGVGLGAWLMHLEWRETKREEPADSPLIFAFSPLVGTPLTTSAKFAVVVRSPLTGMLSDGLSSSHFAIAGKALGVDALVFLGCCAQPSIWVDGRLEPTDLWGASAAAAESALSDRGRVAAIGVAGENGVRFASISNGGRHAGRGGAGAVMGAKRLKAVVVEGRTPTQLAAQERVLSLARSLSKRSLGAATAKYRELGTVSNLAAFNRLAALPTRNFQASRFEGAERLSAEAIGPARARTRRSCAACTIGCEHIWTFADGGASTRIEYESLFALGPLCGIDDPDAVLAAAQRCDEYGLDTVSAGGSIAFAMECGERGWLEGAPRFGDAEGLLALLELIARREGLGDLLADGTRIAARRIGRGASAIAAHVKGLEIPGYEPRALQAQALGFAVGSRGADHNRSSAYEVDFGEVGHRLHGDERTADRVVVCEDRAALIDSLILCKFLRGAFDDLYAEAAELLAAVTGWDVTGDELRATARRIVSLRKACNIRMGWRPEDDTLPDRFLDEALTDGASAGASLSRDKLARMIRSYNLARDWTQEGRLSAADWTELELDPVRGVLS